MDRVYTPDELAGHLQVSANTLKFWRHKGTGPRWFTIGKHVRYREADILAWQADEVEKQAASA